MVKIPSSVRTTTPATTTQSIFCYGTLMAPAVTRTLLRRLPVHCPAILQPPALPALSLPLQPVSYSFRRHPVKSQVFPGLILVRDGDTHTHTNVHGILYYDLSVTEMQILDWYEGVGSGDDAYTRKDCHVLVQERQQQEAVVQVVTQVYVWNDNDAVADDTLLHMDRDWSYERFRDHDLECFLEHTVRPCREELDRLGL